MCRKDMRISGFESDGTHAVCSTTFHLAVSQEALHASLLPLTDADNIGYSLPGNAYPPISIYTYPLVSANPPFPFLAKPPASFTTSGHKTSVDDAHLRSATGLSYTRTMELLKKFVLVVVKSPIHPQTALGT